jgi:hypothetical protein
MGVGAEVAMQLGTLECLCAHGGAVQVANPVDP